MPDPPPVMRIVLPELFMGFVSPRSILMAMLECQVQEAGPGAFVAWT
jgi:hypothetical protein